MLIGGAPAGEVAGGRAVAVGALAWPGGAPGPGALELVAVGLVALELVPAGLAAAGLDALGAGLSVDGPMTPRPDVQAVRTLNSPKISIPTKKG